MKQRITVISLFLIGIIALSFIGCLILLPTGNKEVPIENAKDIYQNAIAKLDLSQDYELAVTQTQEMTVENTIFHEVTETIIQYDMQPSCNPNIYLQENLNSGSHSVTVSECFSDGIIFMTVNGAPFSSNVDPKQYTENLIPATLFTPEIYGSITGIDNGSQYIVSFTEPAQAEHWLTEKPILLQEASGTATIRYDGTLVNSTYTVSYQKDGISYRSTTSVSATQKTIAVLIPKNTGHYTPISHWNAPKALERACGLLIQANCISSKYSDSIYFQAIGDKRTQNIALHAYNESGWNVGITTETALSNDTKQDQDTSHWKQELFINNQYSISNNDETPVINTDIQENTMHNYFQDTIVSTIILPQHIAAAEISQSENVARIIFTGNDDFARLLTENACHVLYQNPTLVTGTGSVIEAKNLQCYLELDIRTGLPKASGIDFSGSYKTQGIPYKIQYSANQIYSVPSDTAKTEIEQYKKGSTP